MNINWKQKLSSRKFWAAVIGFVAALLAAFKVPDMTAAQITAVVSAAGVLIAYIFGESFIDASRIEVSNPTQTIAPSAQSDPNAQSDKSVKSDQNGGDSIK